MTSGKRSAQPAPAVSVVIPARNVERWIEEQLDALEAQIGAPAFEVVIADNGSTDSTAQIGRTYAGSFPVRVVDASQRPGASHARNAGALAASGDVLLFCDSDDLAEPDWAKTLYEAHVESGAAMVAGALHHERFNSPEVLAAYGIPPDPTAGELEEMPLVDPAPSGFAGYLPTVPGGNFAIRREDYLRVGGMDSSYPGGSEETDFSWRAVEAGITCVSAPRAIIHYRLKSDPRSLFRQQRIQQRARVVLWTRFRERGMQGPSAKASLLAASRALCAWGLARGPAQRLRAARVAGGHVGALEGILRYRVLRGSAPQALMGRS